MLKLYEEGNNHANYCGGKHFCTKGFNVCLGI